MRNMVKAGKKKKKEEDEADFELLREAYQLL